MQDKDKARLRKCINSNAFVRRKLKTNEPVFNSRQQEKNDRLISKKQKEERNLDKNK